VPQPRSTARSVAFHCTLVIRSKSAMSIASSTVSSYVANHAR
jgi:hypothetical protein